MIAPFKRSESHLRYPHCFTKRSSIAPWHYPPIGAAIRKTGAVFIVQVFPSLVVPFLYYYMWDEPHSVGFISQSVWIEWHEPEELTRYVDWIRMMLIFYYETRRRNWWIVGQSSVHEDVRFNLISKVMTRMVFILLLESVQCGFIIIMCARDKDIRNISHFFLLIFRIIGELLITSHHRRKSN